MFAVFAASLTLAPPAAAADGVLVTPILTDADAALYRQIFAVQELGQWPLADSLIGQVADPVLMGHVRFQRLMHPSAYRSGYSELRDWLAKYADHPDADRVYRLALRRKPDSEAPPSPPRDVDVNGRWPTPPGARAQADNRVQPYKALRTPEDERRVSAALDHVNGHLRNDEIREALLDMEDGVVLTTLLDDTERAILQARIGAAAFYMGQDSTALSLAAGASARAGRWVPEADWIAGLAAWRLGQFDDARGHFEAAASAQAIGDGQRAAAAYWAARANLATRRPEQIVSWLQVAAQSPESLYGLLAIRQLGLTPPFDFTAPVLSPSDALRVIGVAAVRRAIALSRIGQDELAYREILSVYFGAGFGIALPLLAIAAQAQIPAAELRIGRDVSAYFGLGYSGSLYPLAPWIPEDGLAVDSALLLALMRQESVFRVRALNGNAHGLMQLLPTTARAVSDKPAEIEQDQRVLFLPDLNLELGQRYLRLLLETESLRGNLVLVVAAYNAGPGNVARWTASAQRMTDPLMFMESVPLQETRRHVERVLANLWIYRLRLGLESPEFDSLAAHTWPVFADPPRQAALAAENP